VLVERQAHQLGALLQVVAFTGRANALSFIRLITDEASRSSTLFDWAAPAPRP
jgi:hypothetical protein